MSGTVIAFVVLALAIGALVGWLLGSRQAAAARQVTENLRLQLDAVTAAEEPSNERSNGQSDNDECDYGSAHARTLPGTEQEP